MSADRNAFVTATLKVVRLTFFGVRGSCPCAGDRYRRIGGNTSCVLVEVDGDPPLILDFGTGLRALGYELGKGLKAQGLPLRANALLTHLHFDHILGLPFFSPLADPGALVEVYGPSVNQMSLKDVLPLIVQPPFFPIELSDYRGDLVFHEVPDEDFALGVAKVKARVVPHPGDTLGFRVEADGHSLAYIPDLQAPLDRHTVPASVAELCEGADVVILDAQYTDEEFVEKSNWGHSTFAYAVRVCAEVGAKKLVMFHHDPAHSDRDIDRIVQMARRLTDAKGLDIVAAVEGMSLDLARA